MARFKVVLHQEIPDTCLVGVEPGSGKFFLPLYLTNLRVSFVPFDTDTLTKDSPYPQYSGCYLDTEVLL